MSTFLFLLGFILALGFFFAFQRNMNSRITIALCVASCYVAYTNKFSLAGWAVALCGAVMASSIWVLVRIFQFRRWPIAQGQIVSAKVETSEKVIWGRRLVVFKPLVRYIYEHAGQKYYSEQIWNQEHSYLGYDKAEQLITKYPRGKNVHVYCNPNQPTQVFLEANRPFISIVFLVFGLIGFISVLWIVFGS